MQEGEKSGYPGDARQHRMGERACIELVERSPIPIGLYDVNGQYVLVNEKFTSTFGYTAEDVPSLKEWWEQAYPDPAYRQKVIDRWMRHMEKARQGSKDIESMEALVTCKDGSVRYVKFSGTFVDNMVMVTLQDITEQKRTENALRESEREFRAIFNQTFEFIGLMSTDGTLFAANQTALKFSGLEESDVIGKPFWETPWWTHSRDLQEKVRSAIGQAAQGKFVRFEVTHLDANGSMHYNDFSIKPVTDEAGRVILLIPESRDITESKRAEAALRESEARLQSIFRAAPTGIGLVVNRVITEANTRLCEMTGYTREELLGQSSQIFYPTQEEYDFVGREKYRQIREGGTGTVETRWRHRDGHILEVLLSSTPVDPQNINAGTTFTALDITERKRTEVAILRLTRQDEEALRVAHMGHWEYDITTGMFIFNDQYYTLHGMTAREAGGYLMSAEEFARKYVDPEYAHTVKESIEAAQKTTDPNFVFQTESRILRADGKPRDVTVWFRAEKDARGRTVRLYGVNQDITERKQAEMALRESEENLRLAVDGAHMGMWSWDLRSGELIWSGRCKEIFGLSQDTAMNYNVFLRAVHPQDRECIDRAVKYALEQKKDYDREMRVPWRDGSVHWVVAKGHGFYDADGRVIRMAGVALDITERKKGEEALSVSKARAELYLDLMSHDIINMNQAIMGYLEMMKITREAGEMDPELLDRPMDIINHSTRMINNVKKITQLQAGIIPLKAVDLDRILATVKSGHSNEPGRLVTINYRPCQNCIVSASDLLLDVFDNLVDNAIRHSLGPVTIDLAVDKVISQGRTYYLISITDNGPGIPDRLKNKIFTSLGDTRTKTERTGFGLYLVATLVDYYHGRVWVEDRVPGDYSKGAKFVVELPAV